MSYYMEKC